MSSLPTQYQCHCTAPSPLLHLGEDTGLCKGCTMVYDSSLYEMRLRQHVAGFNYENLDEFLQDRDPQYRSMVTQ